jgi:peptidoglycan-associated lipoprotein
MRRMRNITLLACLVALALGCSKEKAKEKTTPTTPTTTTAKHPVKTPEEVKPDQPVSPSLAISADIAQMCGIKPTPSMSSASPTFEYDKDELTADDRAVLDQLATCLMTGALKGKNVLMIGRADPRGTEEYNMGLGSRRAHSVSQYLVRLGVAQAQLEVTTRGALDATGTDEAGWKNDRRVDVQLATK